MHPTISPEYLEQQGFSPTFLERFWSHVNKDGPIPQHMPHLGKCWLWTGSLSATGYGEIQRGRRGHSPIKAHIASWILHFGPVPKGMCVLHHCDEPICLNCEHLWLGTRADNIRDMDLKGRRVGFALKGELSPCSILTESDVLEIRRIYKPGMYGIIPKMMKQFNVSKPTIWAVILRKNWKHI